MVANHLRRPTPHQHEEVRASGGGWKQWMGSAVHCGILRRISFVASL
jgi:hypothetical protein